MAISGHATMKELVRYTKAADQTRLAKAAMARQTKAAEQIGTEVSGTENFQTPLTQEVPISRAQK